METKRKTQYIHIEFENFKSRKKTKKAGENNNKLTFFAAFTSYGEKRDNITHLNIKCT